jgi:hypothetical protein
MAPMGDDAGVIVAALSQRLRQEQSRSQALQRELQVLRSSEALTFDIQVGWPSHIHWIFECLYEKL